MVHGWNERRRRGVGRGRNEEGNETPVFQRCCIHEAEWTNARTRIKLVPERKRAATRGLDVSARDLHWMASCHVGVERRYTLDRDELRRLTSNFTGGRSSFEGFRFFSRPLSSGHAWSHGTLMDDRLSRLPLSTSPHLQHNARGSACATHEDRHRISGLTRDDDSQGNEWQWGETMIFMTQKM